MMKPVVPPTDPGERPERVEIDFNQFVRKKSEEPKAIAEIVFVPRHEERKEDKVGKLEMWDGLLADSSGVSSGFKPALKKTKFGGATQDYLDKLAKKDLRSLTPKPLFDVAGNPDNELTRQLTEQYSSYPASERCYLVKYARWDIFDRVSVLKYGTEISDSVSSSLDDLLKHSVDQCKNSIISVIDDLISLINHPIKKKLFKTVQLDPKELMNQISCYEGSLKGHIEALLSKIRDYDKIVRDIELSSVELKCTLIAGEDLIKKDPGSCESKDMIELLAHKDRVECVELLKNRVVQLQGLMTRSTQAIAQIHLLQKTCTINTETLYSILHNFLPTWKTSYVNFFNNQISKEELDKLTSDLCRRLKDVSW
jgi:gas vesicle protein